MQSTLIEIEVEVLETIEEGSCDFCPRIGRMYDVVLYTSISTPGEVHCMCGRCLEKIRIINERLD